ncbi:NUDIX hydrolase [Pedococcus sp. 5OH_020]|uniref:NUDIX hydrolase n=1 Tax=Pedococcus sp. 5OH_020 TaxID=2989814 RepID=UPI0022E9A3A2|nr:NUDIX hydrolase [Pedococcus sp. 5OH_020]
MSTTPPLVLRDGDVALDRLDEDGVHAFDVRWEGERVGRVELLADDNGDAELLWVLVPEYRAVGVAERALRLVVEWALHSQGLERVEAHVDDADRDAVRAAMRAGLLKEGVARGAVGPGGSRRDVIQLARLRRDAGPDTREGFIAQLNSALPTKRAIAQGVLRDPAGRVLLCELVYKQEWDLPGGVVDPLESPAECVVREVREELGLELEVRGLLAVNWLPPWRGWSDATVFVFDLGRADTGLLQRATLQAREIRAVHFAGEEEWEHRVAPYNQRLLAFLSAHTGPTAYLEDGLPAL